MIEGALVVDVFLVLHSFCGKKYVFSLNSESVDGVPFFLLLFLSLCGVFFGNQASCA